MQLIAQRFQREIATSELRLMLLQVFIVILWLNPDRFFQTLNTVAASDPSTQTSIANFFNQWMGDCESFAGVHDRRVCALGLCTLLRIDAKYYSAISNVVPQILPNCIHIYQGLIKTYQHQNDHDSDKDTDNDNDSVPSGKIDDGQRRADSDLLEIDDAEDENNHHGEDYLSKRKGKVRRGEEE